MNDLLQVNNLKVHFHVAEGIIKAVDGISFRIPKGGTVALVGESGSGKSVVSQTIMQILPKVARIEGGEILLDDPTSDGPPIDIVKLNPNGKRMRQIRGGRISIIFQEPMTSLSPLHTIGDQVGEAFRLHSDASKQEVTHTTQEILRLVGFPDPERALRTYPFELSGGLRQRAMIAMALICRPALLIADEPTTALDVTIQAQILKLMKDLQGELQMAVLMITHDLGVVANVADEVVVMYHGKLMESGTVEDIFRKAEHPYLKSLLRAVPRFNMGPGERLVPIREIKAETGTLLDQGKVPPTAPGADPTVLKVDHVSKTFIIRKAGLFGDKAAGSLCAVDDVSFTVKRGECLGLVGESGCGKTTLSKIILRAIEADSGDITFNAHGTEIDIRKLSTGQLIPFRRKIQFIFQDPFGSLNPRMTVYDIVAEPLIIHKIGDKQERREFVQELMRLVGLDPRYLRRYPHSFSGGQRQRIGIARALALRPEMIICDEPVSALDVSIQAQVLNLLKDLQEKLGLTYLFISHNLAVVDYIAQRIAVMCAGRLVEIAPREELFHNPIHPYTQALVSAVPEPNLENKLDLSALMEGKASNPAAWPAPFTIDGSATLGLVEFEPGHFVRADPAKAQGITAAAS
ncbi:MAG: ABC transporter ATP-binding protein [Rhodospirillaceae bacterium]|nr:ABC transporter ATP-binding protein [Rhodospirillaceae bacterium]